MTNLSKDNKVVPIRANLTVTAHTNNLVNIEIKKNYLTAFFKVAYKICKAIFIVLLLWLRIPILMITGFLSIGSFICVIISVFIFNDYHMVFGLVLIGSITAFISFYYDVLLSKLTNLTMVL